MKIDGLTGPELIALAKLVSDKDAKEVSGALKAGNYDVDFTVRVSGNFTRQANYTAKIVAKADPWLLLAVALSHLNDVTVESIVRESQAADPALVESLKVSAAKAIQEFKKDTETPCNGAVKTVLTVAKVA